jgi:hypothetical protein
MEKGKITCVFALVRIQFRLGEESFAAVITEQLVITWQTKINTVPISDENKN